MADAHGASVPTKQALFFFYLQIRWYTLLNMTDRSYGDHYTDEYTLKEIQLSLALTSLVI